MGRHRRRRWTVLAVALGLLVGAAVPAGAEDAPGSISGTVTSATDPVDGYSVTAYHPEGWYRAVEVASDGTYLIADLPPASYVVRFARWEGELETQYWPDVLDEADAQPVVVGAGEHVTGIDADLQRKPAVSGTVTGPAGPAAGILVFIRAGHWRLATTAADGTYRIRNLPIGEHVVCFSDPAGDLHPQCSDGVVGRSAATPVPVGRGEEATGVDADMLPASAAVFPDTVGSPFNPEIAWNSAIGVVNGYADGTFGPDSPVTRQAMAAFLFRLIGPEDAAAPATATFSDVPTDHPFHREIEWLVSEGIVSGYSDGTFGPSRPVSRQAMAAFLQRSSSEGERAPSTWSTYPDVPADHAFAEEIRWLSGHGVTSGTLFRPGDPVSRGAMAAFLYRLPNQLVWWQQVLDRRPNPPLVACLPGEVQWSATATPTLAATIVDPDLRGVGARFEVTRVSDGVTVFGPADTTPMASGSRHQLQVSAGVLEEEVAYRWSVRGVDDQGKAGPVATCDLRVDLTPPQAVTITPVEDAPAVYPEAQWAGGIGQEGRFRFASASPDVVRFGYSFDNTAITHHVDATDPVISFTPTKSGLTTLRAQAVGASGLVSPSVIYLIFVR